MNLIILQYIQGATNKKIAFTVFVKQPEREYEIKKKHSYSMSTFNQMFHDTKRSTLKNNT